MFVKRLEFTSAFVGLLASIALGMSTLLMSPNTEAGIITINPSNYADNTDLSTISPHVTLGSLDGSYGSGPITARRSGYSGGSSFGSFELGWTRCVGRYECAKGFGMAFREVPQWVSLSLTLTNIVLSDLSSLGWFAFDANGDLLATGFTDLFGLQPGQFYAWNITVPEMMSLVVGGGDYPSPGQFDRLSFAVGVPEPSGWVLSVLGLAGIVLRLRRSRKDKSKSYI